MEPNQLAEHTSFLSRMRAISVRGRKLVCSEQCNASTDPENSIRSWKTHDHGYAELPGSYPTMASGFFTQWLPAYEGQPEGKEGGHWRIVARGYDKFYNIGETEWTSRSSLEAHTEGPYDLTVMSKGCRVIIAALTADKLLVTLKHSTHLPVSRAQIAKYWLDWHLESVGKTQGDLAAYLWEYNWTMVCELCDDAFEEQILPVAADKTGLRLHGINTSQPTFHTQPPGFLYAFALEWGLIPTEYLTLNSMADVLDFTQECSKTGSWGGEAIEGFVVRTHVKRVQSRNEWNGDVQKGAPPYPPGHSLFFKVKFDEPYAMYRDFREITETLLQGSGNGALPRVPSRMLSRLETRVYKLWVESEIRRDRKRFDGFMQGHGIIATRERFFAWVNGADDPDERQHQADTACAVTAKVDNTVPKPVVVTAPGDVEDTVVRSAPRQRTKWIIYPVGIPGCGKTSIAVALSHLFGFAHTQSDDVKGRDSASVFLANVANLLDQNDVVIADKNNHLIQHRLGLRQAASKVRHPVRMLALKWATKGGLPRNTVHRICADRVAARGTNHQKLIPGNQGTHEEVLWRFLRDTDDLKKDEFDACIEMEVEDSLEESFERAVNGIVSVLGLLEPAQEHLVQALDKARVYQAATTAGAAPPRNHTRYFGLLPEADFAGIAGRRILEADAPTELKELWHSAIVHSHARCTLVVARPHVTLVHEMGLATPEGQALWARCTGLAPGTTFRLRFSTLAYNGRVVAAVLDDIQPSDGDGSARAFVEQLSESARRPLSVTVARRDASIKPVEARELVERWRMDPGAASTIMLREPIDVFARVRGFAK